MTGPPIGASLGVAAAGEVLPVGQKRISARSTGKFSTIIWFGYPELNSVNRFLSRSNAISEESEEETDSESSGSRDRRRRKKNRGRRRDRRSYSYSESESESESNSESRSSSSDEYVSFFFQHFLALAV
jgi:hypothetical protein